MKNIVLYGTVLVIGLLTVFTEIAGQKPAFTLLPSTHHYIHPEAIIDTSVFCDSLASIVPGDCPLSSPLENIAKKEIRRKESKRPGLHLDSLFHKSDNRNERPGKRSGNYPLIIKHINPIKFFLQITALKK